MRYKRRGAGSRLEIIIAAIFAVIGIVLTATLVRLGGGGSTGIANRSAAVSGTPAYQSVSLERTTATT